MIQAKSPTMEDTVSCRTAAPHLSTPHTESTFQWRDSAMMEPATPTAPEKGGETIEDIYKRLPPRGKPYCVTYLSTNETIDEAISRITTLEGMYKMYWMLMKKGSERRSRNGPQEDAIAEESSIRERGNAPTCHGAQLQEMIDGPHDGKHCFQTQDSGRHAI